MSQEEVGKHLGVVGERVRQIEEVALAKLRVMQELVVRSCGDCPCLEDGSCAHPALKEPARIDDGAVPRWCPLLGAPLVVITRLDLAARTGSGS